MSQELSNSRFNMWRGVVSMMHADNIVTPHEKNFVLENTRDVPMTEQQRETLRAELTDPAIIDDVFRHITNPIDKQDFFHLARAIAWSDGHLDQSEAELLKRLSEGSALKQEMEKAFTVTRKEFKEIYLDSAQNTQAKRDPAVTRMIRHLLGNDPE